VGPALTSNPNADEIVVRNDLCYARWDKFTVGQGHLLVIPFRHTPDFCSMTDAERRATVDLTGKCKKVIEGTFQPDGYNIRFNVGEAGRQAVMHRHCHVIPRYVGDVPDPKGGVQGISGKTDICGFRAKRDA
jgi:diadenosine tetraphosphate (Ap4A) HIT family hydrolase